MPNQHCSTVVSKIRILRSRRNISGDRYIERWLNWRAGRDDAAAIWRKQFHNEKKGYDNTSVAAGFCKPIQCDSLCPRYDFVGDGRLSRIQLR